MCLSTPLYIFFFLGAEGGISLVRPLIPVSTFCKIRAILTFTAEMQFVRPGDVWNHREHCRRNRIWRNWLMSIHIGPLSSSSEFLTFLDTRDWTCEPEDAGNWTHDLHADQMLYHSQSRSVSQLFAFSCAGLGTGVSSYAQHWGPCHVCMISHAWRPPTQPDRLSLPPTGNIFWRGQSGWLQHVRELPRKWKWNPSPQLWQC